MTFTTVGILYPGHSAEDDYPLFETLLPGTCALPVQHTLMNVDAHRVEQLLDWGRPETLAAGALALRSRGIAPDVVMWACTSGSFAYGWDGAHEQARELGEVAGVPASSTSLAFAHALAELGLERVAVAATYPADVAALFAEFLGRAGTQVTAVTSHDIVTAAEVGTIDGDRLVDMARAGDSPEAQAVLLPDTAFHTAAHLARIEAAVGKPILTANQVTVWEGLRLGGSRPVAAGLGALFAG
ncbi:maleate cis-trans isomerase [Tsukamurella sp. 8F]|uniref:maleate cis-trans isomerase family protein n=1 Tax=unclassified Tsukamurella TaxID=2633480 RepID=UPI0023B9FE38|nr:MULTISPECIES: maleate cis-trans isomerase [unclassified Tsukamurella]MDF0529212.1 maleate cis-trans isomerase [Tsukamurella sp. 8J]MDF0585397.1 maleate cis-trans isomerase [Tsukamurella sp. 8F]